MQKSECNRQRPRVQARPRNGEISLFQRFLKMGASTADCMWQIAEAIPELLNHETSTVMKYRLLSKSRLRVRTAVPTGICPNQKRPRVVSGHRCFPTVGRGVPLLPRRETSSGSRQTHQKTL